MVSAILEGVILGFTLAFLIGPAFFSLVQTSIHRGFNSGIQFAIGIALSDLTLVALSYLGALQFLNDAANQFVVGIVGGFVLIGFGLVTFFRKYKIHHQPNIEVRVSVRSGKFVKYILKGYFMNILNPFLLIFWIGVMGFVSTKYGVANKEVSLFFAAAIGTVFLTDTFKCMIAHRIKRYLNLSILTWVNRLVGILLTIFGVVMFVRVFYYL